jgi:hypothetical protein
MTMEAKGGTPLRSKDDNLKNVSEKIKADLVPLTAPHWH